MKVTLNCSSAATIPGASTLMTDCAAAKIPIAQVIMVNAVFFNAVVLMYSSSYQFFSF